MISLYQHIYDFIYNYLFYSDEEVWENGPMLDYFEYNIGGQSVHMGYWLTHTLTIITMIIAFVLCLLLVRWIWRAVSSAFLLK